MSDDTLTGPPFEGEFLPNDHEVWRMLEREAFDFRFVQDPIFNLGEAEERMLGMLRDHGLEFGILPRPDPTSFLILSVSLGGGTQKVELAVDTSNGQPSYCSFITRRSPFSDRLKEWLDQVLGAERFDQARHAASRRYVWLSYDLPTPPPPHLGSRLPALPESLPAAELSERLQSSLFNFNPKEQHLLGLLAAAVYRLNLTSGPPLKFHIYPRETPFGGIELMISLGEKRQPARLFVKGFYPLSYHLITENTALGLRLRDYLDDALGAGNLDAASSRLRGRFLSLIYSVRHPRATLERFEN